MDVFFGVLVGLTLAFIFYKWRQMEGGGNSSSGSSNSGGGGYTGVNDGVAGELPKDDIK
jgi:hypothetical protein